MNKLLANNTIFSDRHKIPFSQNICESLIALGTGKLLLISALEDQLRLDPLFFNVEASLGTDSGIGISILVVR